MWTHRRRPQLSRTSGSASHLLPELGYKLQPGHGVGSKPSFEPHKPCTYPPCPQARPTPLHGHTHWHEPTQLGATALLAAHRKRRAGLPPPHTPTRRANPTVHRPTSKLTTLPGAHLQSTAICRLGEPADQLPESLIIELRFQGGVDECAQLRLHERQAAGTLTPTARHTFDGSIHTSALRLGDETSGLRDPQACCRRLRRDARSCTAAPTPSRRAGA